MILDVQSMSKAFGDNVLFRDVSFHIENHEKAALVGINGAGKTTLLKMILGELEADSGLAVISRDVRIGYLSQHPDMTSDLTVMDELLTVKADILALEKAIRASEKAMKGLSGQALEEEMNRYAVMTERFEREGGYALKSEAVGVLKGLGFSEEDFSKQASHLSGGQRTRLAMGRLLLQAPDLLFLDEPTNHLDLSAIEWLETYLQNYNGAVLVVSHDRYFLNKVVSKVIELDHGHAHVFSGSFDDYSVKKEALLKEAYRAYLKAEAERAHQEAVIKKLQSFNREKSIKRAESRIKKLEKTEVVEKPETDISDMRLHLEPRIESGHDVLHVEELSKAFGPSLLFDHLTMDIKRGERVSLIGANGTGKSTILKILNDIVEPDRAVISFGTNVTVGYYDQEMHVLHDEKTIFEEISDDYPTLNNTKIRTTLAAFLFTGEDVFKRISLLSGGEKARISLAKLMLSEANFLILDEPTNHLDIQSREILENALTAYTGTVLVVSHDRYFINRISTRILELKDKTLASYPGNYDDMLHTKEKLAALSLQRAGVTSPSQTVIPEEKASLTDWKARKAEEARKRKKENDLRKTEDRIASLEERDREIDDLFNDPAVSTDHQRLTELSEEKDRLASELEDLYEKWAELSE